MLNFGVPFRLTRSLGATFTLAVLSLLTSATAAAQAVSPTSVTFPATAVSVASAASAVTFTNSATTPLTINSISASAPFHLVSTNCPLAPSTLSGTLSCTASVTFNPTETGYASGSLTFNYGTGSFAVVPLSGTGSTGGATSVSPGALTFGSIADGKTSSVQSATFTNNGGSAITLGTIAGSGDFMVSSTTCGASLAAAANCKVNVTFTPSVAGVRLGTLSIPDSADANPVEVSLSGTGLAPVSLSPSASGYGNQVDGVASAAHAFTLTNNQTTAVTVSPIGNPGSGFSVSSTTCGSSLAGGAHCLVNVVFTPTAPGHAAATLSVTTSQSATPLTVALTGTGVAAATLSPTAVSFGNVAQGFTSSIYAVTFTNYQSTSLTGINISVSPAGFALDPSTTCGSSLAAHATCSIGVTVNPISTGPLTGSLTVTDTQGNNPPAVGLSANGIAPVILAPSAQSFGSVVQNTTSPTKILTLTNNQTATLPISSINLSGPFAIDTGITTCGSTLAAGASCKIGLTFQPNVAANATGQLTVNDTASNTPQFTTLTGVGLAPVTALPTSLNFGSVVIGTTSAGQTITLHNNQSTTVTGISFAVPAPYALAPGLTTCGGTLGPRPASCTIGVTVSPTAVGPIAAGALTITDSASNSPQSVALTASGQNQVVINPTAVHFGRVVVNIATTQNVTLTNKQAVPLAITSLSGFTGGFTLGSGTTCPLSPATVPAGGSCTIQVQLTPPAVAAISGSLTVAMQGLSSQSVSLLANAVQPVLLTPANLYFGAQYLGTTTAAQVVTLTNVQAVPLNISGIPVAGTNPGDYSVTSSCGSQVAAGASCNLSVTFSAKGTGSRTAALQVTDDAAGSPQLVQLHGSGNAPLKVLPTSITNFTANVGTTSAYQTVTITNTNPSQGVTFGAPQVNGDFLLTSSTCPSAPTPLAGGASCAVTIEFNPTIGGTRDGQLIVNDTAATSPQVVNLAGNGTNPLTRSTPALNFSAQLVNTSSPAKVVVLTNHESQPETFSLATSGDYSATTNCASGTIAANASCNLLVTFTPSSTSPTLRTGSLTITDSAPGGSPLNVNLTGSSTATNPAAAVAVVSPGAGAAGTNVNVVITGNGWTHFSASSAITFIDTDSSSYPSDITVSNVAVVSANELTATLTLAGGSGVVYGARTIRVVTPLSGGGNETAALRSAFIIADPSNAHDILSFTPGFGKQGQTEDVDIVASSTNFVQGTTFANFGAGITVNALTINSPTTATANITISNTTTVGNRIITMMTGGEFATSAPSGGSPIYFQVGANNAALVSVSSTTPAVTPVSEPQSFAGPIYLTATGTHFLQSATTASITGGVIVGDVLVTSPTTATAQVIVPSNAAPGTYNVTVATGGEIASLSNSFTVTGSTPALVSIAPSSAKQGASATVTITGNTFTDFSACPGGTITADFTGEISNGAVHIVGVHKVTVPITVSQNASVGSITANLTCGSSGSATIFPFTFTVTPSAAQIVSVVPNSVAQGAQVTLNVTGLNTNWVQGTTMSAFYPAGVPIPSVDEVIINSATSAQLAVAVPTTTPPGNYTFWMATGGQIVNATISVYANTPTLTMSPSNGLVPMSGSTNFTVNFTGQFTHWVQGTTLPVIAGQGVVLSNFKVLSPVSATGTITLSSTAATGLRLVTFTTGGEIETTYYNVTSTPVGIYLVSPYHAAQSKTLNVAITGLNTHFVQGTTQVIFGGPQITVNSVTVSSPTKLTANITTSYLYNSVTTASPPGWQTVYVNTGAEQVTGGFAVDAPGTPTIVSVSPNSVAQGATVNVTITGSLTNWVQGTSNLIMGAGVTVANLQITSPTTATATISADPTAPIGGNSVIMVTGSEYDSGQGFSVTPSSAYITNVAPNVNCQGNFTTYCGGGGGGGSAPVVSQLQTATLNITGVGTHWLQGDTTLSFGGGVSVDTLTVTSPTTMTAQITVLSTAPVGFATATATTDGEIASMQQAIDIEEGSPTLLAISPGSAQQGATINLEVLGRFTGWNSNTVATFNQDITVNSITVVDSETAVLNITVSPLAYVDTGSPCGHVLTLTTGSQQVSTAPILDNFCVSQGAEEITGVSPAAGVQGTTENVTITGSATNFINGVTTVSFGDSNIQVGTVTVTSPTSIMVPIAISTLSATGFKTVTATTFGQVATQQFAFTVSPGVAQLVEAIPNQAEQGVQNLTVKLIGQYSHFSSSSTATFGAGITVVGTPTFVSATEIDAVINIDPLSYTGSRDVTVTTPNVPCSDQPPANIQVSHVTYAGCTPGNSSGTGSEIVDQYIFNIIPGPAIITGVSPNTGNEGQEIVMTISGANTHWAQNFTQFYIAGGGSEITVNDVVINSPTSATVDMTISPTANPGTRSVYMVTAGESLTDAGAFVVTGGVPVITYLSPNSAEIGTNQLEVTINGLYTNWTQSTTAQPNFGPGIAVTSYTVDDATHISAVINVASDAQLGYRTVIVTTGTQALTGNFLVTGPPPPPTPYIWYETPSTGIPGQTLTINWDGINTEWNPNPVTGTQLTGWNSAITVNSFQITSANTATANITISPTATQSTSTLTFTTPNTADYGTEVDTTQFTVVVAQPTLSIVDPGSGMQGAQNINVNVLGQFTAFDATTTFSFGGTGSGITVNSVQILGPGIANVNLSIDPLANLGGYSVTAYTPDATNVAQQVVGGAGFSVTPSLATILSVSPNTAPQGTTNFTVSVVGQNTLWTGATTFQFGAGIVVTNANVTDNTHATLTLSIPPLAGEGSTYLQARTSGEVATLNQAFVVTAGTPLLLSSGPGSVEQQGAATFTVLSQATNWLTTPPTVSTVSYGAGITVTNVNVTSDTSMTVSAAVSATTPVGYRNLTVTTGTQSLSINNAVYVGPGPAVVNSVSPSTAGQGQTLNVAIQGINTNWVQGVTTLSFPDVQLNSFTITSATTATANITVSQFAPAGLVNVTMTTLGEVATKTNAFQITQTQPEMLYIGSPSATQGQTTTVTITALNTTFGATTTATFGTGVTVNSVNPLSATQLQVNLTVQPTATLGYRTVSVTTGTQVVSSPSMFSVTAGPAAILSLSPASGGQGTSVSVSITGSQTNFASGVSSAAFGGGIQVTGFAVTDATHATATINIPNSTPDGSYNVTVTTGGEVATILGGFTVTTGSAKIASVSPATGDQGSTENVTITGQFTNFVNGTSVASFGAGITVHSTTVSSATSAVANITITPTATIGSRTVTVKTNSETASITGGFSVLAGVPAITSAAPGSAAAGSSANVVINGAFTSFQQNVTTVSFGSGINVTAVTVASATQLTASITINGNASVGSRDITVTTNSQQETLSSGFSVTPGTPVITEINPNFGNPGQTLSVNIYGQYTNWVNGTTTANFGSNITINSVTVSSPTQLAANITIGASAPVGPVDVTTTTTSEVESVAGGFTIQAATIPAPSVISLSPGPNVGGIPLNAQFTAVFSQPMNRADITNSTMLLYLTSNQGQGNITVPGTVAVDATGRVATFTPTGLLAPNSTYYLQLTNGIYDATGNRFGGQSWDLYTGSSSYTTPPTVVATNPPASSTVGTNILPAVQFSADMNQSTQAGLVVSTGGNPVTGAYSWNSGANCCWGPGTILTFTPSAPLAAGTTYTVSYATPLTDTAGNAVTNGSFTFKTGSGPDTVQNYTSTTINGQSNIGTNIVPAVQYTKPVNLIDINSSTLLLYDNDSGKYIQGAVTVAANGLSAKFTPSMPLEANTTYHFHQAWGYYDADANYLNGIDAYFTTGAGPDSTPPTVTSVSPANAATGTPLNAQVVVRFSSPINPNNVNVITVTPSGGSAINGSASLAGDGVTLTFIPTDGLLPSTSYTVSVSGFTDLIGNTGTAFTSAFQTGTSYAPIVVSTGLNASGQLIAANNTNDAHWTYIATTSLPTSPYYQFSASGTPVPLQTVGSGDTGFYSGWPANGPLSDWITINPNSTTGNTMGVYSTTFNIPGSVPSNLCLIGSMGVDDNGELGLNGTAITGNINAIYSMTGLNIPISSYLVSGTNTLALGWGSTDNSYEAFRLQAVIQSCGASDTPGQLSLTGSTPANNATNVPTSTASITLTFNNPIDPLTVNANTLPVMVNWNSNQEIGGTYAVSGNTVTFTPDSPFPPATNIWVGACNGPLDLSGDSAGSCYTQLTNFTTGVASTAAGTPFAVVAFTPANNANGVGLNSAVMATFNRSYNPGTINPNSANSDFALFQGDNQSPWCTSYSRSQDNTSLSFNCGTLPSSSIMTAELNSSLQDWAGDPLTNFSSQFTTNIYDSTTDGSIITSRPGSGSGGVSANQPLVLFSNLPINTSTAASGLQVAQNNTLITGTVAVLDGGYTMVFTPSSSFTPGALIQWWTTGTLFDATYNNPINGASGYFYVAGSTATLTPTVQVASPPDYTSGVAENTIFDIQFNTPLNASTVNNSNIYLYDSTAGLNVAATYSMPQTNEVRMVPSSTLPANHYVYVYINSGLQSTTSEPAAASNWYEYTGTTTDTTTPTVTSAVPYSGAVNVGVNDTPGVIFSKPIDPVSVNSTTFQVLNGTTPLTGYFWFNSSNTRVEFVPYAPLPASKLLTMKINGVLDLVGNSVTYTSTFTTGPSPDFTSPTVLWTSVASNGSIPINGSITVQFSESMDASTFSPTSNFYLRDEILGTDIPATLTWSSDQSVGYLVPSSPLAAGRQYYFNVTGGTDLAGNAVNGVAFYVYADFTSATAAPTVVAFNPISGTTNLGTNTIIEAEFSAPIDPNTLSGVTLKNGGSTVATTPVLGSGNTVLQLVPASPLTPGTTYTMTVAGVKDPAGNVVATVSNSFTTGGTYDINPASVVSYDPPYNATVGTNVIPKLVFSKPLNPITVSNSTFRMFLNDTGQWIPLTVTPSADGLEVTLAPQIPLLPGTYYHYQACCGYQDMDGNNGNQADLYFYTSGGKDSTGPTVSVTPLNGATSVPLNANVLVTTSEPIDVTSWNQNSVQVLNGSTPVPGLLTQNSNQMFTFVPTTAASSPAGTFLGCYADNGNRALGFNAYNNNFNTVEGCVAACGSRGYQYAGVQDGNQCFCGSGNYTTYGASSACTMTCTGNSGETCGGNLANDVYTAQAEATPANLAAGVNYTVKVTGLKDDSGNVMTPFSSSFTTGTAASTPGLSLVSTNIPYNATGVSPTTSLVLTFSQVLDPATVNSSTMEVMNTWNSNEGIAGTYTVSGDQVTFVPLTPFPAGANITVGECGGPADDLGELFYVGACWQQELMNFTVSTGSPDTTAPTVVSVSPTAGATNVPHDVSVSVTFSKSMNPGSGGGNNTELFAGQDPQDIGSVNWSTDHTTMTFNVGALSNGADYTIVLPAGGLSDMSGNTLASTFTSTFTTDVNPATGNGSVIGNSPGNNATGVPTNTLVTLYLNRQADATTVPGNLTVTVNGAVWAGNAAAAAGGYEVQFTPTTAFPAGAVVQWFFSNVYDVNGDVFNGTSGTFYTAPTVNTSTEQPQIVAVSPAYSASNVPLNAYVDLEYNVPVSASSLAGNVYFTNSLAVTISQPAPNIVRLTPTSALAASTTYAVCANANVLGTNSVAAQYDCYATYFTTGTATDSTTGTITVGPPTGSVNVGTNAYIRFLFSKPVDPTSFQSATINIKNGTTVIPGTWTYNYTNSMIMGANFFPTNPLPPSKAITVAISGLKDYVGDTFGSISKSFTTGPTPDTTNASVSFDFSYGQTGISTNATFTCRYTEAMDPSSITPSGTYIWSYSANAQVPFTYTFSPDMMSVTMTPSSALAANSEFNYTCNNAIDLTGNAQSNGGSDVFYTGSGPVSGGPTLLQANPPNNTTGLALNTSNGPWGSTSLNLLFNEALAPNSLGNLTLTTTAGTVPINAFLEDGNSIVVVQLGQALQPGVAYTYNITGLTDYNGNAITPVTSTFTTGNTVNWAQPTVTSALPANGATGVVDSGATISVTFSEPMNPVLIDGGHVYLRTHNTSTTVPTTFTISPDYKTITITPTASLAAATIYDLVTASPNWYLTDYNGNAYTNTGVISTFTTQ